MHRRHAGRAPIVVTVGAAALGVSLLVAGAVTTGETVPGYPVAQSHFADGNDGHNYPLAIREAAASESSKKAAAKKRPVAKTPATHSPSASPSTSSSAPAESREHAAAPQKQPHERAKGRGEKPPPPAPAAQQPEGLRPGTIRLPQGGTAALVRAEVGADRTLPIPNGVNEATWWGAGLGARGGATLFSGHVNWQGRTGPFNELWGDRRGQIVEVVDAHGKTWRYRINQLITLHKNELPARAQELFGPTGPARVVLVTCGGRWAGGSDGYESNRIAIATPI